MAVYSRRVSSPIVRHLFRSRQRPRMYTLTWDEERGCTDHRHDVCECGFTLEWSRYPDLGKLRVDRFVDGRRRTYDQMYFDSLKQAMSLFYFEGGKPVRREVALYDDELILKTGFEFYSTSCNIRVAPPFDKPNMPGPAQVRENSRLREIVRLLDWRYLQTFGLMKEPQPAVSGPHSLTYLAYRRVSLYQTMFTEYAGCRAVVNTSSIINYNKIIKLFSEYAIPATDRKHRDVLERFLGPAMKLVEEWLGANRHREIVPFRYGPDMLPMFVSHPLSASGIRAGKTTKSTIGGVELRETVVGKKLEQFSYYAPLFHECMQLLFKYGLDSVEFNAKFQVYCHIALKNEFKFVYPPVDEDCVKLADKCREFFIPNMMMQFLSKLLMTPRQKLERGDWIRIGQKWNHGGAEEFAKFLHANAKIPMVWFTGDFKKLDKTIKDFLLAYYVASGKGYFRVGKGGEAFFRDLFILLAERINVKLVNHVGGIWTLMLAMMYSGGFETSHGDSWCVLMVWVIYVLYTAEKNPKKKKKIMKHLGYLIRIAVYGDDHVWCVPWVLRKILNEAGFAEFVKEFFDMEIREPRMITEFFSRVLPNGELSYAGVVFLKRYFILDTSGGPGFPVVYPFKPTHESLIKLFCSRDGLDVTYVLQAIGQAYDTLGTNAFAYSMIKRFYKYYLGFCGSNVQQVVEEAMAKADMVQVNRLLRKANITADELKNGFPTLAKLRELHKVDASKNTNKIHFESHEQIYGLDFDRSEPDYDFFL